MTAVTRSPPITPVDSAPSFLDPIPWVNIISTESQFVGQGTQNGREVHPLPGGSPRQFTVPSSNRADRRARRYGIICTGQVPSPGPVAPNLVSLSARPEHASQPVGSPTQPKPRPHGTNQDCSNALSGFPTSRGSQRPLHDNNQGTWCSDQDLNPTQTSSGFSVANYAGGLPITRGKRRQAEASQQQGIQIQPRSRRRPHVLWPPARSQESPQTQVRVEKRIPSGIPQFIEPGCLSMGPRSGSNWPSRLGSRLTRERSEASAFDAIRSSSRCLVAPVIPNGWDHAPKQTQWTQIVEADSTQPRQSSLLAARPSVMRSSPDSSDNDIHDEKGACLGKRTPPQTPAFGSSLTTHQDRSHIRIHNPRLRVHSPCAICLDVPDGFPDLRPTANCTHASTICGSCLEQYISHAVITQGSTTLTCPDLECRKTMEHADVVRGAGNDKACLERYEALRLRRTLEGEPNFVWCKNPNCNWGQLHGSGADAPVVTCQVCKARSCFVHGIPWHTGLSCEQYTQRVQRDAQEQASQAYIDKNVKVCPSKSCGRRIEKVDGCDHMTCRRPAGCGHEFCWDCLADYDPIRQDGNHRHNIGCRYYAAIEPPTPSLVVESLYEGHHARLAPVQWWLGPIPLTLSM